MELLDAINDSIKISINNQLLQRGYAEKCEESNQSKKNHEQRVLAQERRPTFSHPFKLVDPKETIGFYDPDDVIEVQIILL